MAEIKVTIIGGNEAEVQRAIWDLADDYSLVAFTLPVRAADGKWMATGRVSEHQRREE